MPLKENIHPDEFPALIRDYARYKQVINGSAEDTVTEYLFDLRTFFRYQYAKKHGIQPDSDEWHRIDLTLLTDADILTVTPDDVFDFLYYTDTVRDNKWCAKSRKLSALRGFYKYLVQKRKLLEASPVADIESPKRKQQLPKVLSLDESLALLNAIKNDEASKTRERDYCMVTLFLNCGMRLSELCGIRLRDIDPSLRSLRVIGKGSKERIIYLNQACQDTIQNYLNVRVKTPAGVSTPENLFLSSRMQGISQKTVQYIVYKYLDAAGLGNKHYSVHKLRHTAATLMYQSGNVDVRVLKDILGHEQLNTTQIYTHVSDANMEHAMTENPLSRVKPPKPISENPALDSRKIFDAEPEE